MPNLTHEQINQYKEEGYIAPIDVLTKDEAEEVKKEIEYIEKKWPNEIEGLGRNYVHLISPVLDKVSHNSKILDAVESIIGKIYLFVELPYLLKIQIKKVLLVFIKMQNILV